MKMLKIMAMVIGGLIITGITEDAVLLAEQDNRDEWQRVPDVFKAMGIEEGSYVADIGAGWGYFTTRLGNAVGAEGRVFAVDINEKVLRNLRRAVEKEGLDNVEVVISEQGNPELAPASINAALIVNAYHEMTAHEEMLSHIFQALKPGGRLVILDRIVKKRRGWSRADQAAKHELGIEYGIAELEQAGFIIREVHDPFTQTPQGQIEWILVGERPVE